MRAAKSRTRSCILFPDRGRSAAIYAFERAVEQLLIVKSVLLRDLVDGRVCADQVLIDMGHPHFIKILKEGHPHVLLEEAAEIFFPETQMVRDILEGDLLPEMFLLFRELAVRQVVRDTLDLIQLDVGKIAFHIFP